MPHAFKRRHFRKECAARVECENCQSCRMALSIHATCSSIFLISVSAISSLMHFRKYGQVPSSITSGRSRKTAAESRTVQIIHPAQAAALLMPSSMAMICMAAISDAGICLGDRASSLAVISCTDSSCTHNCWL